jgi:hypothetical protein
MAIPLTEEKKAYYRGYEKRLEHMLANCWTPVENCVLNTYTELEDVARKMAGEDPELRKVLDKIDRLRELRRGMWARDLKV